MVARLTHLAYLLAHLVVAYSRSSSFTMAQSYAMLRSEEVLPRPMVATLLGGFSSIGQGGDQIVSKAASAAIAALFKQTEHIDATVRAEPVAKLLQGSMDGFDFVGNGLLMYNGLRIKAMELYVQAVSIDFGAVLTGKINLRLPTEARLRVLLTEEDLTTSFNTPFVVQKLQKLEYDGQNLNFQSTKMSINGDRTIQLNSLVRIGEKDPIELDINAKVTVEERRRIQFSDVKYSGDEDSVKLAQALVDHVNELMDLDKFALDGTQLRIDQVRVRNDQLTFYGTAQIERFPERKKLS